MRGIPTGRRTACALDCFCYGARVNDAKRQLADIVDGVLASYEEHGNINHLDGTNLPSLAEVGAVQRDLFSLLFPGFFGRDHVDELTSRYFVGERCARAMRGLETIIERASIFAGGTASEQATDAREHAASLLRELPELRRMLTLDVRAAMVGDPAARSEPEVISSYPGIVAIANHRVAHHLWQRRVPLLPRMMSELIHSRTGIDIHPGATIGEEFFIDHGTGVVIGETSKIGARVQLYQGVTLGALSTRGDGVAEGKQRHPTLDDDVTVYAAATILGGETVIGKGSTIGGNVWLTHSVEPGTTVLLGAPSLKFIPAKDK
jgi:serine O-acetyltransferase